MTEQRGDGASGIDPAVRSEVGWRSFSLMGAISERREGPVYCSKCGNLVADGVAFCPACGQPALSACRARKRECSWRCESGGSIAGPGNYRTRRAEGCGTRRVWPTGSAIRGILAARGGVPDRRCGRGTGVHGVVHSLRGDDRANRGAGLDSSGRRPARCRRAARRHIFSGAGHDDFAGHFGRMAVPRQDGKFFMAGHAGEEGFEFARDGHGRRARDFRTSDGATLRETDHRTHSAGSGICAGGVDGAAASTA